MNLIVKWTIYIVASVFLVIVAIAFVSNTFDPFFGNDEPITDFSEAVSALATAVVTSEAARARSTAAAIGDSAQQPTPRPSRPSSELEKDSCLLGCVDRFDVFEVAEFFERTNPGAYRDYGSRETDSLGQ